MKKLNLRETQLCLLNILKYTKKTLEKNDLNYSLAYGTLIGAARHKGFIPWDEDLDIIMPYNDYLKMLQLPEFNNPNFKYTVHYAGNTRLNNEKKYDFPFAKIEDNTTQCIFKMSDEGGGAFLDIFPLTPVPLVGSDKYARKMKSLERWLQYTLIYHDDALKSIAQKIINPLYRPIRNRIIKEAFKFVHEDNYKELTNATWGFGNFNETIPREWMNNYTTLEFEGEKFRALYNYDEWLTNIYGDWRKLPPMKDRVGHHFFDLYSLES